jgi:hypothetical protein
MSVHIHRRLKASILGILFIDGQRTAMMIPKGAIVRIASTQETSTEVSWDGTDLTVFTEDLDGRSEPILRTEQAATSE